jgi:hypothetical protein
VCLSTVYLLDFGTVPKLRYRYIYIYIFNLHHFASINLIISHMYHERHLSQIKKRNKKEGDEYQAVQLFNNKRN